MAKRNLIKFPVSIFLWCSRPPAGREHTKELGGIKKREKAAEAQSTLMERGGTRREACSVRVEKKTKDSGFPLPFSGKMWYTSLCYEFHKERIEAVGSVTLIGMPGSGKSTVGVLLAKALGFDFLDTDLVLQQQERALLQEILDRRGVPYFLDAEERAVRSVRRDRCVIAPGGSVVCRADAMEHLRALGPVLYLRVPLAELKRRIDNLDSRGIALEPGQTLEDIWSVRAPLYERYADAIVDAAPGQTTAEALSLALACLERLSVSPAHREYRGPAQELKQGLNERKEEEGKSR